jgi:acyl-coenzyme A thioesterase PaaI-like protein
VSAVLKLWQSWHARPFGKAIFTRAVCMKAPYFGSIKPRFEVLESGHAVVSMKKRRAVQNHIGTVHAIAMCNLAELAAGTMTEASIPKSMRWLPKGMTVEYIAKAETDIRAECRLPAIDEGRAQDVPVEVSITNTGGKLVCRAVITMYVSPRKGAAKG